jgi:HPt (histidine-containing phosphotransfer) domain-containing protein
MTDSVLDLARTAALGDPATDAGRAALIEIFRVYFDDVTTACSEMRQAATSSDDVRKQAHRAKGASGVVGAVALGRLFADLEAMAAAGETCPPAMFDDVDRQLTALRLAVSAQIGEELQ